MKDKRAQVITAIKGLFPVEPPAALWAFVRSVEGQTCTVELVNYDLEPIDSVQLVADESDNYFQITPAVGSLVLVGIIEKELTDLAVLQYSTIEAVNAVVGGCELAIKGDELSLKLDEVSVTFSAGKLRIKNGSQSLKSVLGDVANLFQSYRVTCASPGSPSAPFPESVQKAAQLQTKINALLYD